MGGKRRDSACADMGIEVGLGVLADVAPLPAAVIGGVILGVGLLGFLAWKACAASAREKVDR